MTSSACPSTFTDRQTRLTMPEPSMRNVERLTPFRSSSFQTP
jgi:hypothetical protein